MILHKAVPLVGSLFLILCMQAGAASVEASNNTTTMHKVRNVVLESGNPGQIIPSGNTTMETANLACTKGSGCTLGMRIMASLDRGTCQDDWAIVGLVDGNSVDGGPLQGPISETTSQVRVWQGVYTVGYGSHTLAFQLHVPCSVRANQWSVRYSVTTP